MVKSTSFWRDCLAYLKSRFHPLLFIPLAALLLAPGFKFISEPVTVKVIFLFVWMLGTLFSLRLWDDLASLKEDRILHPQRVLTRSTNIRLFFALTAVGFFISLLGGLVFGMADYLESYSWRLHPFFSVTALLMGLLLLYRLKRRISSVSPIFYNHLLLLKYPVLAFALMQINIRTLWWLAGIYLLLNLYEFLHDAKNRQSSPYRFVAAAESVLLILCVLSLLRPENTS